MTPEAGRGSGPVAQPQDARASRESLAMQLLRWHVSGTLLAFAVALIGAMFDARRRGPLYLRDVAQELMAPLIVALVVALPVVILTTVAWMRLARRIRALECNASVRLIALTALSLGVALASFLVGAVLTGRPTEVWTITDRFSWLPQVPALVVLLWPIMASWLVMPRLLVASLRGPLV